MEVRLTKRFRFEMAHALLGHDGPCRNIHGHSYELDVCLKGKPRNESGHPKDGMVMDFSDLSAIVHTCILADFDHALVIHTDAPVPSSDTEPFGKVVRLPIQPTCENLVLRFSERLRQHLPETVQLYQLRLRETSSSWCDWFLSDNTLSS